MTTPSAPSTQERPHGQQRAEATEVPVAVPVVDVVVRMPKTLGSSATVADARDALRSDHTHMVLITDSDGRLLGTLVRDDLGQDGHAGEPVDARADSPALEFAVMRGRTVAPDTPADEAMRTMVEHGERRRAVVDEEGRLVGLLCLKRRRNGFCSDADVTSRTRDGTALSRT